MYVTVFTEVCPASTSLECLWQLRGCLSSLCQNYVPQRHENRSRSYYCRIIVHFLCPVWYSFSIDCRCKSVPSCKWSGINHHKEVSGYSLFKHTHTYRKEKRVWDARCCFPFCFSVEMFNQIPNSQYLSGKMLTLCLG